MRLSSALSFCLVVASCKTTSPSTEFAGTTKPPFANAPAFEAQKIPLEEDNAEATALKQRMIHGGSMKDGCPVGFENLTYLKVRHVTFNENETTIGELVIHKDHADAMIEVFRTLYTHKFPIASMRLVDDFGADDTRSMDANNTSAFNCRKVTGTNDKWSQHSYGNAIDINPIQNPYIKGTFISPKGGKDFIRRDVARPGLIQPHDHVVAAFQKIGWRWGGDWKNPKDYQHFSSNGL